MLTVRRCLLPLLVCALAATGCSEPTASAEAWCSKFLSGTADIAERISATKVSTPRQAWDTTLRAANDAAELYTQLVDVAPDDIRSETSAVATSSSKFAKHMAGIAPTDADLEAAFTTVDSGEAAFEKLGLDASYAESTAAESGQLAVYANEHCTA